MISPVSRRLPLARLAAMFAAVAGIFLLFRLLPVAAWIAAFKVFVIGQREIGFVLFALVYVVVSLVPGAPAALLTLAGGAVFGFVRGTLLVSAASTIGATLAFLLARTVLRTRVSHLAASSPRFETLTRAVGEEGGRIVALVRLSPVFPFTIVNYLFGLTPVRPVTYVLASWGATLPGTAAYVFFGSALGDATSAANPTRKAITLGLGLAAIVATGLIARFAAKAVTGAGAASDAVEGARR